MRVLRVQSAHRGTEIHTCNRNARHTLHTIVLVPDQLSGVIASVYTLVIGSSFPT